MVELKWQDPPSRSGNRARAWDAVIEQLKAHPGKWALIATDWTYSAPPAAFRQQGCEATARRNKTADGEKKKTWSVYARCPIKATPVSAEKLHVQKAVANGTALTPPAVAPARQAPVRPANDMGLSKFLADRRARGAADIPE